MSDAHAMTQHGTAAKPLPRDRALRTRAAKVIPGGMWGHMSAKRLPPAFPQFFRSAEGTRLTDVDGNVYVDFMCAYGPMILGYNDPDVEAAARAQHTRMSIANGPGEAMVDLAELMVETIPAADWAIFGKNGTDATTACVTIARAATGKRKILIAKGAYHGSVPWCTPWPGGVLAEDRAHLIYYTYNDVPSLEAAAADAAEDLAGIMACAFRHDARADQEMPTIEFARAARSIADRNGAALIIDDVRAGFRLNLGGSWEPLGVQADLSAWSKAMGNGHPIAAITGKEWLRDAAQTVYLPGSFWCAAAPMVAAITTLQKLRSLDAVTHMARMGQRLRDGIADQAAAQGVGIRQTGPAQMPLILFDDDEDLEKGYLFTTTALQHGVYLHPWHNMFLSAAHSDDDIDRALEATQAGLAAVANAFR